MSLNDAIHLVNRGNKSIFASVLLGALSLMLAVAPYQVRAASSAVNGQVCPGALNLVITAPLNNDVTTTSSATLTTATDWASSLTVANSSGVVVASSNLSPVAGFIAHTQVPLANGANHLVVTAAGSCPNGATQSASWNIYYTQNGTTINSKITNVKSPRLSGMASNFQARIFVVINGTTYEAVNNRDTTWTLAPDIITPDLSDGSYDIRVYTTDSSGVGPFLSDDTFQNALIIDNVIPTGSISDYDNSNRSPRLSGSVTDPEAQITVIINGKTYVAVNNRDGTWHLPAGSIEPLASGRYPVIIRFSDAAGNVTSLDSTLDIQTEGEIGFILPPNTGYLRIGQSNLPSYRLYVATFGALAVAFLLTGLRSHLIHHKTHRQLTHRQRRPGKRHS